MAICTNASYVEAREFTRVEASQLSRRDVYVLSGLLLCLLAIRLLLMVWLPMTDTTEARYAEIARKMLETGNWITPQYDYGVPFWGKPPLHTWASAFGMKILGVGHVGARLPILVFSISVLCVVYSFARQYLGPDRALICITVLASSILFYGASAFVMTDMALTLGTTLSMCAFYRAVAQGTYSPTWDSLFFVGLALGLLAKGPVAVVLTAIPISLWVLVGGRWHRLRQIRWTKGAAILLVLSVPWYAAAEIATPGFLRYFLYGEHIERFIIADWQGDLYGSGHEKPKGIVWLYACAAFLPWTFFVLVPLRNTRAVATEILDDTQGWHSFVLLWALSPMLLFTPAANLLPAYTLPALPAVAILLSSLCLAGDTKPSRLIKALFLCVAGGTATLYLALALASFFAPNVLNLRTDLALIAAAHAAGPEIQLTYWGERSYSAEFYTFAHVRFTEDIALIAGLQDNAQRDALAVPTHVLPRLEDVISADFENMGMFRNRILFVESANAETKM